MRTDQRSALRPSEPLRNFDGAPGGTPEEALTKLTIEDLDLIAIVRSNMLDSRDSQSERVRFARGREVCNVPLN